MKRGEELLDAMDRAQKGDGADWNRLIVDPIIEHQKRAGLPLDPIIKRVEERSEK